MFSKMFRMFSVLLILICMFLLCGCSNSKNSDDVLFEYAKEKLCSNEEYKKVKIYDYEIIHMEKLYEQNGSHTVLNVKIYFLTGNSNVQESMGTISIPISYEELIELFKG